MFVKVRRDLELDSSSKISYNTGQVYVYLKPEKRLILIIIRDTWLDRFEAFIKVAQEAWGFDDKDIKRVDKNTIHILYKNNIKIINNYIIWKVIVIEEPKPVFNRLCLELEDDSFGCRQDIYEREWRGWIQDV